MRVTIVSRIYAPEVSAASGLLTSWAEAFRDRGADVTVVTTTPPHGATIDDPPGIRVKRAWVLRDRQQYVRGYLSYLSFDVPLVFRLLFARKTDLYVVEPPPTTVAVVRIISILRRTPYIVDAADLWSDAAALATRSTLVLKALRRVERFALQGAARSLVVHQVYADRMRELNIATTTTVIGFGADTGTFVYRGESVANEPLFVYAGTYSEWHGAQIFVEAFARLLPTHPHARLRFIGNGQERDALRTRIQELGIEHAATVETPISPAELAPILAGATASLASLKPDGYHYAMATKVFSSLAAGCPVIFAGGGPTAPFIRDASNPDAGRAVEYDVDAVVEAMRQAATAPLPASARAALSTWTHHEHSLAAIARVVANEGLGLVGGGAENFHSAQRSPENHE